MKEVQNDSDLTLQIAATGMHLSPEFGLTYRQIEHDGFTIDAKVETVLSSDTPVSISKSIALGVIGFAEVWERLKPDIIVVLGDRYEILAVVQAALITRIPVAHIHGGEITEGAIDDSIRHSITKMSHLHFVTAESYRQRVIQLGESPERVFNFGAPGLDAIQKSSLFTQEAFEREIDFSLGKLNFLVTYHPVTLGYQSPQQSVQALLNALDAFPDAQIIFTGQNSDTEGRIIWQLLHEYVESHSTRSRIYSSLGQLKYLSAIQHVDVVIGNSSSGLSEVTAMKKPTVNIGDRQKGRLRADSVIDCKENTEEIVQAIHRALSPEIQQRLTTVTCPYGAGNVSPRIKEVLKTWNLKNIFRKPFYDLPKI